MIVCAMVVVGMAMASLGRRGAARGTLRTESSKT
jgi:hypothetical protein